MWCAHGPKVSVIGGSRLARCSATRLLPVTSRATIDVRTGDLTFKNATPFLRNLIGIPRLGFKVEHSAGDGNHRPARWRLAAARPGDRDRHAEFKGLGEGLAEAQIDFGSDPI